MTAATVQSTRVSGLVAQPRTVIDRALHASTPHEIKVSYPVLTTNTDDVGDIILLTEVPWTANISSIRVFNDAMDTHSTPTLTADVGLYKVTHAGTVTVLDADAYASAITTLQAANKTGVEVAFESGVKDIDATDLAKKVFEDAGLTAVPNDGFCVLGVTITATAATGVASADLYVQVRYTM